MYIVYTTKPKTVGDFVRKMVSYIPELRLDAMFQSSEKNELFDFIPDCHFDMF